MALYHLAQQREIQSDSVFSTILDEFGLRLLYLLILEKREPYPDMDIEVLIDELASFLIGCFSAADANVEESLIVFSIPEGDENDLDPVMGLTNKLLTDFAQYLVQVFG